MEYNVIERGSLQVLVEEVNQLFAKGWSLQGGVSHNSHSYCQALSRSVISLPSVWRINDPKEPHADSVTGTLTTNTEGTAQSPFTGGIVYATHPS